MASELGGPANPNCADDKNDLRQDKIEQAKFLFEDALRASTWCSTVARLVCVRQSVEVRPG